MKKLISTVIAILALNSFANTPERLIQKSDRVNRMVQNNADYMSQSEIRQAIRLLNDLRNVVTGNGGSYPGYDKQKCIDFTYEKYFTRYNSTTATDKAIAACKTYKNMKVMKKLYNYAFKNENALNSITLAVKYSGSGSEGKYQELQFMLDMYFKNLNGVDSARKAGAALEKIERNSLNCLESMYERYYRSNNSKNSMDKAVQACGI